LTEGRRRLLGTCLAGLVLVSSVRLLGFAVRFGAESLQLDFAAYYTAGEAVRHGLSPYRTHARHDPPIWDGADVYRHSRFLYPPLVARLFAPVSMLPYGVAKRLWTWLGLVLLALALALLARAAGLAANRREVLAAAGVVCLYHPLLALVERGQIDAATLALIAAGLAPLVAGRDTASSGLLLAAATVIKLNAVYLVPFLLLRRRVRAVAGYAAGVVLLLALSAALDGPNAVAEYVRTELPRIARFGEGGTSDMLLSVEERAALSAAAPAPPGWSRRDGRLYRTEPFGFVANASLARTVVTVGQRAGRAPSATAVSVALLLALWLVVADALRRRGRAGTPVYELAFWQAALAAVLMSSPLSWAMNTVWLLPSLVLLVRLARGPRDAREVTAACLCAAGLLVAAVPDHHAFPLVLPWPRLLNWKYLVAEAAVFASMLILLRGGADPERAAQA
jgi:hypothetical protein